MVWCLNEALHQPRVKGSVQSTTHIHKHSHAHSQRYLHIHIHILINKSFSLNDAKDLIAQLRQRIDEVSVVTWDVEVMMTCDVEVMTCDVKGDDVGCRG